VRKCSQTLRGSFFSRAGAWYTENIGGNEELSPLSGLFLMLFKEIVLQKLQKEKSSS